MGAGLYYFWDGDDIFSTSPCHCDNLCRNTSHNLQEIKRMRVRYVIFSNNNWILFEKIVVKLQNCNHISILSIQMWGFDVQVPEYSIGQEQKHSR